MSTQTPCWNSREQLPLFNGSGWALLARRKIVRRETAEAIRSDLRRWSPLSTALVARPGDTRFVPAIEQPELRSWLTKKFRAGQVAITAMLLAFTCLALIAFSLRHKPALLGYAVCGAAIAIASALELHWGTRDSTHIARRTLFLYWLTTSWRTRFAAFAWALFGVGCGAVQFLLIRQLGGLDQVVAAYGTYYPAIRNHEYWRLLTGPFLHSGIGHLVANVTMLILAGTLCSAFIRFWSVIVFMMGSIAGATAAAVHALSQGTTYQFDSFGGFSGGIFALLSVLIAAGLRHRKAMPPGLLVDLSAILFVTFTSSLLTASSTSSLSHIAGIIVGLGIAPIVTLDHGLQLQA